MAIHVELTVKNATRQRLPLAFFRRVARESLTLLKVSDAALTIVFVGQQRMVSLAAKHHGKSSKVSSWGTNVLAFSYRDEHGVVFGDVVLCVPIAAREAREAGRVLRTHLALLLIHGIVHLAGYRHRSAKEAAQMTSLEEKIARHLNLMK